MFEYVLWAFVAIAGFILAFRFLLMWLFPKKPKR